MKTIWKFQLLVTDLQSVPMPRDAKIIAVQTQGEEPCIWAIVDPDAPKIGVKIFTCGTGHELPDPPEGVSYRYLGTYQLKSGALVFHVFRMEK